MTGNERYVRSIRRRLWIIRGALALMLVFMVVVGETGGGDSRKISPLANNVGRLLFFGGEGFLLVRMYRLKKLLGDRLLLKAQRREDEDERNRALHLHSGGWVMDVMLIVLMAATTVCSLYNMPAFHACLALLLIALALKGLAYRYAMKKL